MSTPDTPEIWIIRHKETHEVFKAPSGKNSWKKPAHAKNAWGTLSGRFYHDKEDVEAETTPLGVKPVLDTKWNRNRWEFPRFDEQDTWELVKLETKVESKLGEATLLLQRCLGRLECYNLEQEVKKFLEGGGEK